MSNAVENTQCCVTCDEQITGEVMTFEDESYCQTCHEDEIRECDSCECQNHEEHTIYVESSDELVCEPCSERHYEPCNDCDELQPLAGDNLVTICQQVGSHYHVCFSCYENHEYMVCQSCSDVYYYDEMYLVADDYFCYSCYQSARGRIHSYNYEPYELNFHHIKNGESCFTSGKPLTKNTLYMGVELEIDSYDSIDSRNQCSAETANDETLFFNKEDGSLDYGFEIVSHPFTMDYFNANKDRFHKRIKTALKHGFRSHDVGTCGMHIHVSKDALSNLDIFKIVHFMYSNVDFIKIISNRTWSQINEWCSLDINSLIHGLNDPSKKVERICRVAKRKGGTPKYVGLNLAKDKTIEFRIFRGTLNWSTYQKNVHFVHSLIQWIKSASLEQITSEYAVLSFLDFLCRNQTQYNHLILFIFNRFYSFDIHEKKQPPLRKIFKHFDLMSRMNNKQLLKKRSI